MNKLKYFALTFTGRRKNNQDSCKVIELGNDSYFLVVADGMGGVAGGQIASNLVIEEAKKILIDEFSSNPEPKDLKGIVEKIFLRAQISIKNRVEREPKLAGMGTTLSSVLICGEKFVWGNLGDSRIYLFRNDKFLQITEDHTYIQDYKSKNEGPIPQYIIDQYSHYLIRSVDGGSDKPDIFPINSDYDILQDKDIFLLCSDGLITNKVETNNDILLNNIKGSKDLKSAAQNLIANAFYSGSNDNISVVLAEFGSIKRENLSIKNYYYPPSDNRVQIKYNKDYKKVVYFSLFIILVLIFLIYQFI